MNIKTIYTCFPGGRHKALTMSYDDGKLEDIRLTELFRKYGIKGTFHLNSGLCGGESGKERISPDQWQEVYRGQEVSCHTVLHPTIARSPISQVALQVLEDRRRLEEQVGYPIRGMSYPNGSYTNEIKELLPKLGIEYSRIVGNTDEFSRDQNWELIEEFCRMMAGREDIWYATNIEIADYMKAAQNLKFTVNGNQVWNPSAGSVWISVNGEKYEVKGGQVLLISEY